MNGINFPPEGSQGPAPFPGGVNTSGQPVPPQPVNPVNNAGAPAPYQFPSASGSSMPIPPPQPVGSSVPPPPPPEIGIRTMASDMKTMQSSGGAAPTPKTFKPADLSSEPVFRPTSTTVNNNVAKAPSPIGAPGVKVIAPANHAKKSLLITIVILVALAAIGSVAYFFILPMFMPAAVPPVTQPITTTPITTTPVTTTPVVTGLTEHQTFFTVPASLTVPVSLDLSLASVQAAIVSSSSDIQPTGTFKEISLTSAGKPFTAQDFLGLALSGLPKDFTTSTFEQDFTSFVYYDKNGAWPGYVFKLKSGVDPANAKATVQPIIEASPATFFQTNPGTSSKTTFSDGTLPDGKTVRFVSFSKKGAALEYSWFGNYLTISTSYQGLIEAVKHLGS